MITKLNIENWYQFGIVSLDFHDNLTIIIGTNDYGKHANHSLLSRLI